MIGKIFNKIKTGMSSGKSLGMTSKGQIANAGIGIVTSIGVTLLVAVVIAMVYGNILAASGQANTTLNLVNSTIIPLIVLIFALTGAIAIVLRLANNAGQ